MGARHAHPLAHVRLRGRGSDGGILPPLLRGGFRCIYPPPPRYPKLGCTLIASCCYGDWGQVADGGRGHPLYWGAQYDAGDLIHGLGGPLAWAYRALMQALRGPLVWAIDP